MTKLKKVTRILILSTVAASLVVIAAVFWPNSDLTEERTVRVALFQAPASVSLSVLEEDFESEFNVNLELELLPYAELQSKIEQQFLTGTSSYDVVMMDCILVPVYASRDMLAEVDPAIWEGAEDLQLQDLLPALDDYLTRYPKGGPRYGMPFMSNTHMMTYRPSQVLNAAQQLNLDLPGTTVEDAWTWSEYLEVAQYITQARNDNSNEPYGTVLQARSGNSMVYEWYSVLFGFINDLDARSTGLPKFDEGAEAAMSFYAELYRVAPPAALTWAHEEETSAMCQGLTAMDATSNVELAAELLRDECQLSGELAFAYPPVGKSGVGSPDMGGYGLLLTKQSRNPNLAAQFILWAASPSVHQKIVEQGGTPIRFSEIQSPEILQKFPYLEFYDQLIEDSIYRARIPKWTELQDILSRELAQVVQGEQTSDTATAKVSNWIDKNIK
ncbi:MAG: extracellular solute-binding protein [Cyanobacteria bacterium J06650_10]